MERVGGGHLQLLTIPILEHLCLKEKGQAIHGQIRKKVALLKLKNDDVCERCL